MAVDPSDLFQDVDRFDSFLGLRLELMRSYRASYARVQAELDGLRVAIRNAPLVDVIDGAGTVSKAVPPSWILQEQRYLRLQSELRSTIVELGDSLRTELPGAMRQSFDVGRTEAERLMASAVSPLAAQAFASVPESAARAFVAASTSSGSPLNALLSTFSSSIGGDAQAYARDAILSGLVRGRNLATVGRELAAGIEGMSLSRALTIARTETLRARREANLRAYAANDRIVESWTWRAAVENVQHPPCGACFARHGSVHPVTERMQTHPNCRCRMIPNRKGLQAPDGTVLRPTGPATKIESGERAFRQLPLRTQRSILGPTRYRAWKDGAVPFDAFGSTVNRGAWGPTLRVTPLRSLGIGRSFPSRSLPTGALGEQASLPGFGGPTLPLYRTARTFATDEEALAWADAALPLGKLTGKTLGDVRDYTAGGYDATNRYLRGSLEKLADTEADLASLTARAKADIKALESTMAELPESIQVHRALWDDAFASALPESEIISERLAGMSNLVGRTFTDPGYLSTSLGRDVIEKYVDRPIHLHLDVLAGTRAANLRSVSYYRAENELLLEQGVRYVVTRVEKTGDIYDVYATTLPRLLE